MSAIEQLLRASGDLDAAERVSKDVLSLAREIKDTRSVGVALLNASYAAILRGRAGDALAMLRTGR